MTACDQDDREPEIDVAPRIRGGIGNGSVLTLNTNQWIASAARDVYEFTPDGQIHLNSFGYQTHLISIELPDTPYGNITTVLTQASPGEARLALEYDGDLMVQVSGPTPGDATYALGGEDLVGLKLGFGVTAAGEVADYAAMVEITEYSHDAVAGSLFNFQKVDPYDGAPIAPLCEADVNLERFARVYKGLNVDGKTGQLSYSGEGTLFHLACTSGAPGKASLYGYPPESVEEQTFALVTRVIRADYCADGHPYTYPGNSLSIYDNFTDGQSNVTLTSIYDIPDTAMEAVWGIHGVLCVDTPRNSSISRTDIVCPYHRMPDGEVVYNWQPPSCVGFEDPDADAVRLYSKTLP